jgi:hypothetical protein
MITKINILLYFICYHLFKGVFHSKLFVFNRPNTMELMKPKEQECNFRGAGCVKKRMLGSETEFNMATYYPTGLIK